MRSIVAILVLASAALLGCDQIFGSGPDGSVRISRGVGGACASQAECRAGLVCEPASQTCQPRGDGAAGSACTLTGDCGPRLYCASSGLCATAGEGPAGTPCADSGGCARGLVCARLTPGIFGACAAPRGTAVAAGDGGTPPGDGGTGPGDGGPGQGGGAQDLGGSCNDVLDCLAGLACEEGMRRCRRGIPGEGLPAPWPGERCEGPADGGLGTVTAYFEIPAADGSPPHDFFRLPYPNDVRRDPATGRLNLTGFPRPGTRLLGFDIVDRYARASERHLDGFGTNQLVYFRFSGNIEFNSLRLGDSVRLVDLTTGQATGSIRFGASTGGNRYLCPNHLVVDTGTGTPMEPGHTYAAFLTMGVRDTMNRPVLPDADFRLMLATAAPPDPVKARAWAAYEPFRRFLDAQRIDRGTVVNAAVFTTQQPRRVLGALRDAVRATAMPAASGFVRCDSGVRSPCDDGLTGAAHVRGCIGPADPRFEELQGRIEVPVFQRGPRPYRMPGEGEIPLDAMGRPVAQGTEAVCVTVTIPRGAPMPAAGHPVVLYAHGTGGNYRSVVTEGIAGALAAVDLGGGVTARLATVGYEGVMHGERRGMGVTEPPDVLFFNFANPEAARDNVVQGAADVFALVRALESLRLPMLPAMGDTVAFDRARVLFLGHSQGATVGIPAVVYEPGLAGIVLSGAGGDLRLSLTTKRRPVDIAALVPVVLQDPEARAGHPALNLLQAFFERVDAANYGRLMLFQRPAGVSMRPVVQTYGLGDSYSTPETMQVVAQTIGLPAAAPIPGGAMAWPPGMGITLPAMNNVRDAMGSSATAVLLEVDPMGMYDGHFVLFRDAPMQRRVMGFLATAAAGMAAVR